MSHAFLDEVGVFGVRHHSPRSSAALSAFLDERRPALVLVEGPSDATHLIDVLVDPETRPPVAVLAYTKDGSLRSSVWPFAAYSPEYVALAWARRADASAAFIDVPASVVMAGDDEPLTRSEVVDEQSEPFELELARRQGCRSFEELWEASFEAPPHDHRAFTQLIHGYAELVRARRYGPGDRARDVFMLEQVKARIDCGVDPKDIVVVVGAAHAAAFAARDIDKRAKLPKPTQAHLTLIPFSFPRLAEQLGYGAGNRAPHFYQRAHDAGCDYRRATLEVLLDFSRHLRLRGFSASLADTIEAYRLALALAELRGKSSPGLDEVREATIATLCRGDSEHVDGFLWPSVIGTHVGQVAERIGKNSLQEEFWREVRARRLPEHDRPETFALRLTNEVEVGTSIFLHRLRIAEVPYASFVGGADAQAGGVAALRRVRESWESQWTPATDIALVSRITLGDSLAEVAARSLEGRLEEASSAGDAADVLLDAVLADCPPTVARALERCEALASEDDDLVSLARASHALSGLVSYGSSRALGSLGDQPILALCTKTFYRAVARAIGAAAVDDDGVGTVTDALRLLHEVAMAQPRVDKAGWLAVAGELAESYAVHPRAAGLAAGLLYLGGAIADAEVARLFGQRLSGGYAPDQGAAYLEGFLSVNAVVLVKSREVVEALDAFIEGLSAEQFADALPALRRAFSGLGLTERRYLLENLVFSRGLVAQAEAAAAVLTEQDSDKLEALGGELDEVMDDLDDLL